jgi:hypothetical protein
MLPRGCPPTAAMLVILAPASKGCLDLLGSDSSKIFGDSK